MANQIIKQPNGKYCIFSNVVDYVTYYNLSTEEIIDVWVTEAKKAIEIKVKDVVTQLESEKKPYHQFTMTYNEMIDFIEEMHGKKEAKRLKTIIE